MIVDHHTTLKAEEKTGIILVPQPTDDLNDPYNWPKWKKYLAILPVMWYCFMTAWVNVAPSPALVILVKQFNSNLNDMSRGCITWPVFCIGAGVRTFEC